MIEVRVTPPEMRRWHPCSFEIMALGKCKDAGMPLLGTFLFRGVERGVLVRTDDFETGDIVYRWREDAPTSTTGAGVNDMKPQRKGFI